MGYTETARVELTALNWDAKAEALAILEGMQAGELDAAGWYAPGIARLRELGYGKTADKVFNFILKDEYQHFNILEEEKKEVDPDYAQQAQIGIETAINNKDADGDAWESEESEEPSETEAPTNDAFEETPDEEDNETKKKKIPFGF
jgi:hypothetical protein